MGTQRRPVVHAAWQAEGEVDGADGVRLATLTGTNELSRTSDAFLERLRLGLGLGRGLGLGLGPGFLLRRDVRLRLQLDARL